VPDTVFGGDGDHCVPLTRGVSVCQPVLLKSSRPPQN
jgi:hypothetical protein